jgi:cob(I)alamin adenosyltransferase
MLYTRKGDDGTTQLYSCVSRFSKASLLPEALGSLDELNSYLGLCKVLVSQSEKIFLPGNHKKKSLLQVVQEVQETLFTIQAEVAGAQKKVSVKKITALEKVIDSIEEVITPIHSFTIPGGTVFSVHFDIARTLARKVERRVIAIHEVALQKIDKNTLMYLNRLSSLLYALARYMNYLEQVTEEQPTYS